MKVKACDIIFFQTILSQFIFIYQDEELQEFYVEEPEAMRVGDIYCGKVLRILPDQQGIFVDIGENQAVFLKKYNSYIENGQLIFVKIIKLPTLNKGAKVSLADINKQTPTKIGLVEKANPLINKLLSEKNINLCLLNCEDKCKTIQQQFPGFRDKIQYSANLFEQYSLDLITKELLTTKKQLTTGEHLTVELTEALTVIDVNAGKSTPSNKKNRAAYLINQRASIEILKQIRLLNLAGIIIVDYINMLDSDQEKELRQYLISQAKFMNLKLYIGNFSESGLLEITRKRTGPNIIEILTTSCSYCNQFNSQLKDSILLAFVELTIGSMLSNKYNKKILLTLSSSLYNALIFKHKSWQDKLKNQYFSNIEIKEDKSLKSQFYQISWI